MNEFPNLNQTENSLSKIIIGSPNGKNKPIESSLYQYNTISPDVMNNKNLFSPTFNSNDYNSNSKMNYLTEKKKSISKYKIYSPSPNSSKTDKISDRFIPTNKGVNLMEKFNLALRYDETDENGNNTNIDKSNKYDEFLKQNFLNENSGNFFNYSHSNKNKNPINSKIFSFKSENNIKKNPVYSIKNIQRENEDILMDEHQRKINPKPYKILNANGLMDDFYLNLVDWSSKNDIAVGLGNKVELLCTNQTQRLTLLSYLEQSDNYVSSLMWNETGELLAVGNNQGYVEIYDAHTHKMLNLLEGHSARIGAVSWNGNIISSGSKDCCILSRDIRCNNNTPNNEILNFVGHNQEICGLKWSFDGTQLASGGNDNKLLVWNLYSTKPIMVSTSHTSAVKAIAWSPHQHNLLVSGGGTADRTIRFWNTTQAIEVNKIETGSQVCNLVFSKTVNELVSTHGFSLNQIMLWKLPSMTKIATLTGHTYRVLYLALSPDGQNIVTGAGDETLRFWNLFPPYKIDSTSSLFPSNKDIR